jgi:hypothetical protein
MIRFDTLRLAQRLHKAGMAQEQADAVADALNETMGSSDVATRADVAEVNANLKADIAAVRAKVDLLAWMIGANGALTLGVLFLQLRGHP